MKALFSLFRGIETEKSDINSTPESLIDCKNVLLTKDGFISSRHGHPQVYFSAGNYISTASTITAESIFRYKASDLAYKTGIIVKDSSSGKVQVAKYSGSGDLSSSDTYTGPTDVTTLVNSAGKSIPVQNMVRTFNHDTNTYYLTEYGLTYGTDLLTMTNSKGIIFPVVNSLTYSMLHSTSSPDNNWMSPRKKISVKVLFELEVNDKTSNSRKIKSAPSDTYELYFTNNLTSGSPVSGLAYPSLSVALTNILTVTSPQQILIKVYRTVQYEYEDPAPVEYFQCYEEEYNTSGTNTRTIALTINDDGILSQERLYTDPNIDGDANQNYFPLPARDVVNFKNYYLYSYFIKPTIFECNMTGMPDPSTSPFSFSVSASKNGGTATSTFTASFSATVAPLFETNPTAIAGGGFLDNILDYSFQGSWSSSGNTVKIKPGTTTGCVNAYAKTVAAINSDVAAGDVRDVIITPSPGLFDLTKFTSPGFVAITLGAVAGFGTVRWLLQYQDITEDTATGTITFKKCLSLGRPFGPAAMEAAIGTGFYFYYIPGQSSDTLPLYIGDETAVTGYFSLLPAINKMPDPVVIVKAWGTFTGADVVASNKIYLGILKRSPAQLLDDTCKNMVKYLNNLINTSAYARSIYIRKLPELGKFTIEINDLSYENINISVTDYTYWSPKLEFNQTKMLGLEESKNGIYISRQNNPESIPLSSVLAPILVGRSDRRILKMVANSEFVYVFKENEGIFQLVLSEGGTFANVQQVQNIDRTVHLIASESVQVIDESIFFLSHKGFRRIAGNQIQNIGDMVDTEVRKHLAKLSQNGKLNSVRSYANESKGYYCCYLPGVNSDGSGISYVYNLRRGTWSKFDKEFDYAVVDEKGLVTSLCTDYTFTTVPTTDATIASAIVSSPLVKTWQYLRSDVFTSGDPDAASDKYDDSFIMTNYTFPTASATSRIKIQSTGNADPTDNLINILYRLKGKKLWYVTNAGVKYPLSIVATSGSFNGTGTTYIECTFDGYTTPPITPSVSDSLVIGVNVSLEMKAFVGRSPDALSHFTKISVHTNSAIYKMSCSFKTDTQASYTTPSYWSDQVANRTVYVATVNLAACRGRFLNMKLTHTTPKELFSITGLGYEYNEAGSRIQKDQ